jgi:hypothetical protein
MKVLGWTAALSLILFGWAGSASADPGKDESGNGRWRGGYERSYDGPRRGYGYGYERPRRERRAFKQEYDDGNCKVERKWERSAAASTRKSASAAVEHVRLGERHTAISPIRPMAIGTNHRSPFADGPLRFINQRRAREQTAR